jgi:serine/threonine protein kinase
VTQTRFDRVREVFVAARALNPGPRGDLLERECHDDSALRVEVECLLAHHDRQRSLMTVPVVPPEVIGSALRAAAPPRETLPRRFGEFELLEIVGSGGMGVVYRARQHTPERIVALKVIHPGMMTQPMLERFRYETDVLARLQHPGIARIFEAGTVECGETRQPYFAMEFIDGEPIDTAVVQRNLNVRERLLMMMKVCDAVHHAHQKGVIHRDLKPANILVDEHGEPRILDFGVARVTDIDLRATILQTDIGQLVGTLPYMSPEQVSGDPSRMDTRSDVYALGVLTFEILTGALPYDLRHKTIPDAVLAIRDHAPRRLSAVTHTLRGDLDTIVAKALEKEPSRRYESAAALADDVRRYLGHRPIIARPASAMYQMRLFARRHRALVAGGAVAAAALVLGAGVSLGFAWRSQQAATRETKQREIAERTNSYLTTMLTLPDPHHAGADMTVGQMLDQIVERLDRQVEIPEVEAQVRTAIGRTFVNLRMPERAVEQLSRAVDLWRMIDPRGPRLGEALLPLGIARLHTRDFAGSESAYREALAILEPFGGAGLASVRGALLDMLLRSQKYQEAAPIARAALEATRKQGDMIMTIARLRQVAKVHWGLGEYSMALEHLREARDLGERHLPETHPLYYNVWLDVSVQRHALGDHDGALEASGRAYELVQRATPAGSNDWTGCLMAHLASLEALGHRQRLIAVLTDAQSALANAPGNHHALMADIQARLKRWREG